MTGTGDGSPALAPHLYEFRDALEELNLDESVIYLCESGSRLYGTDNPDSDMDIKGVFVPHPRQVLLGRVPRTRHIVDGDLDAELFSLHHFMYLLSEGQTVAMEMLHVQGSKTLKCIWRHWQHIEEVAPRLLHKNLGAFVGYAKAQADKYVLRAERYAAILKAKAAVDTAFEDLIREHGEDTRLSWRMDDIWQLLPVGNYLDRGTQFYRVCTKAVQRTTHLTEAAQYFQKWEKNYGQRIREVDAETGIDWKSLSHAVRVASELKQLLTVGKIAFPLWNAQVLRDIRNSRMSFDEVGSMLKHLMEDCDQLMETSNLPDHPDYKAADEAVLSIMYSTTRELLHQEGY